MKDNPMLNEPEVMRLQAKAEHFGLTFEPETTQGGHLRVVVSGTQVLTAKEAAKRWCPNAIIQGNAGPNALAFIWENGVFVKAAAEPPTKPEGSKPDSEVLDEISRQQLDTLQLLKGVVKKLDTGIEEAYPGIFLSNEGFGKGKRDLMCKVLDALHDRSSRNVPDFWTHVTMPMAHHFVKQNPTEVLEIPESASAWAKY
jgi:hypothetical protein